MVTVPACPECNHDKSKDEPYLREVLVADLDAAENSAAQAILNGPVLRSWGYNCSDFKRAAMTGIRLQARLTPAGLYLGHYPTVPVDGERLTRIFATIVRGLYNKTTRRLLPPECSFEVGRLHPVHLPEVWEQFQQLRCNGPYRLGTGVFGCIFAYANERASYSRWLLWFYDSVFITVDTDPQLLEQELDLDSNAS